MNVGSYGANYTGTSGTTATGSEAYSSCSYEGYYQNYEASGGDALSFQQPFHACEQPGIITSDNGLSYTNLDTYQAFPRRREKPDEKNWYEQELGHYVQCEIDTWNVHYMKEEYGGDGWSASGGNALGALGTESLYAAGSQPLRHRLQTPGKTVPTYKWMQVKRNVPKPAGNFFFVD